MTTDRDAAAPGVYEFEIAGTIGPTIADCLPEISTITETHRIVVAGTAAGPDDLHRVLDLLTAHGAAPVDIRITHRR